MFTPHLFLTALLLAGAAACHGGVGTINGEVAGKGVAVKSGGFTLIDTQSLVGGDATTASTGSQNQAGFMVLSDTSDICADANALRLTPNKNFLFLLVASLSEASGPPPAGTYAVIDPNNLGASQSAAALGLLAEGGVYFADAQCQDTLTDDQSTISAGNVTVSAVNAKAGGTLSGTFDLQVGSQKDALTGSFDAPYCPALTQFFSQVVDADATTVPCGGS